MTEPVDVPGYLFSILPIVLFPTMDTVPAPMTVWPTVEPSKVAEPVLFPKNTSWGEFPVTVHPVTLQIPSDWTLIPPPVSLAVLFAIVHELTDALARIKYIAAPVSA